MTSSPPGTASDKLGRDVFIVAGVVVLGAIMSILDVTVVAVAQPTFMSEFDTTSAGAAWSMTGYTLALAAVIPTASWAASRFGTKRVYMASLILFLIGSVLCAMAWNIGSLVAFRVLQGFGGGLLMPIGMMIMTRAAGPERVGSVMAVLGIPMLLGPIMGPILGGWLIEIASWHWVFLINVPIGVIALVYAFFALPGGGAEPGKKIDFPGLLMLSPGLALFLFGVSSSAEERTFGTPRVYGPMIVGAILIIAFVWHAFRTTNPLLDLRLFRNSTLRVSVITMSLFAIAFFGASLLYPQYFIVVRGESTLMAGLLLAPQGLGAMLTMPIAGKMTDKIGPGKFVLAGLVLIAVGVAAFITLGTDTSYWFLCLALFVQGLGMGMTMMPIMSASLATLRGSEIADGSTLMNAIQQTSSSIGTAVITVIFTTMLAPLSRAIMQAGGDQTKTMNAMIENGVDVRDPAAVGAAGQNVISDIASTYGNTFIVATALVALTLIPAFFLPRKKMVAADTEEQPVPVALH
ncbi:MULTISPECIES: DHA2 family efflux MFS transporter permease subunit [Gordonia]|uniref:MFS transporter n=2 Tax=Gordonia TaxID=2053 RepID=A0ABN3HWG8_9ACTN|nr:MULTISPECIES: DHA2 family efflux MFS transporter permease subunit [Gordonia]AUH68006.1 MFS transporter [Gordonia sp. YC-JH1]KJR08648.1 multidrug transporter [Gordonia sihwensis]KXT58943.1 multidrug transporter [Gordonia sp. QH-12]MBY4569355.1 MFS transporter [Gordonia sihwensis]WFN92264.1 DHA2 family efflux MFS transporter permease subunit [Gordonia sihwensis]